MSCHLLPSSVHIHRQLESGVESGLGPRHLIGMQASQVTFSLQGQMSAPGKIHLVSSLVLGKELLKSLQLPDLRLFLVIHIA